MKMYVGKLVINVMRVITFIERMMFSSQGDIGVIEWNRVKVNLWRSKIVGNKNTEWDYELHNDYVQIQIRDDLSQGRCCKFFFQKR